VEPVASFCLWTPDYKLNSFQREGSRLYKTFENVFFLKKCLRINGIDDRFEKLLMNVRKKELTFEDLELLKSRRESVLSPQERAEFRLVPRIYPRNAYSRHYNFQRVKLINQPIFFLKPRHLNPEAPSEIFSEEFIFPVSIGVQVRLTRPLDLHGGLVTGTPGIIEDFIFESESTSPTVILVRFENVLSKTIHGITPIPRIRDSYKAGEKTPSYPIEIFPLALNYAFSVHLAQGQTIPKVAIFLDQREFFVNQTYVCLSRAVSLSSILILDREIPESRFNSAHFYRGFAEAKQEYERLGITNCIFEQ